MIDIVLICLHNYTIYSFEQYSKDVLTGKKLLEIKLVYTDRFNAMLHNKFIHEISKYEFFL